jgi:undecaprenyl-diphosphatase
MLAKVKSAGAAIQPKRFMIAAAVIFVIAVWSFAELADDAVPGNYLEQEAKILRAFRHSDDLSRGLGPPVVESVVRDLTALGSETVLTLVVALVVGFLFLRRRKRAAWLILAATLSGMVVGSVLKNVFHRSRPQIVPHLTEVTSLSFPSGHSMMSSVVYLTLGALLAQTMARRREKIYIVTAAVSLTVLVGLSRVYLGVHYPSDVAAGWAAGVAWALLFWAIAVWLQQRGALRRPEGEPQDPAAPP